MADLRKLGFSMRVERSTVDQVKNRLQSAAKRKYDPIMTKKLDAMEGAAVLVAPCLQNQVLLD